MIDLVTKGLTGLVAGLSYALTGFGKSKGEAIDWKKLTVSVLVGCGAGVVSGLAGWEMEMSVQFLTSAGITVLVENLVKTLWRRGKK